MFDRSRFKAVSNQGNAQRRNYRLNVSVENSHSQVGVSRRKSLRLQRHSLAFFDRSILRRALALFRLAAILLGNGSEHEELWARDTAAPHHGDNHEYGECEARQPADHSALRLTQYGKCLLIVARADVPLQRLLAG